MTFLLALMNSDQAIQVSDRRLTSAGRTVTDEANKALVFDCRDARLIVGILGFAQTQSFRTVDWLGEALLRASSPDYMSKPTLERLAHAATVTIDRFKSLPGESRRLTLFFNGYLYSIDPPLALTALISNFQSYGGAVPITESARVGPFRLTYMYETRASDSDMSMVQVLGAHAMLEVEEPPLRQMLLDHKPAKAIVAKAIVAKAVHTVREIGKRSQAAGTVGQELTSIVLPRDRTAQASVDYHPSGLRSVSRLPGLIVAHDDGFKGGFTSAEWGFSDGRPLIVPKTARNAPCPCGSGEKYKRCHGR